jgi:tetratricopeptide (TPR) repeat protein
MTEPVQAETVAQAVVDALHSGPLAEDDVLSRLAAAGMPLSREDLAELRDREYLPLVWMLSDERLADVRVLLSGKVFTHRLSSTEIEHDLVAVSPDLQPVAMLTDGPELFEIDGTATDVIVNGPGITAGEVFPVAAGALTGARPGDLIGLRVGSGGAALDLRIDPGETPSSLLEKLRGAVRDDEGEIRPVFLFEAVYQLCADDPALFLWPLAPLGELVEAAGLAMWGDYLAPTGFDVRGWLISGDVDAIQAIYGLSAELARAIVELGSEIRATAMLSDMFPDSQERQETVAAATATVLAALHVPDVGSALSVQVLKADAYAAADLASWVDQQRPAAPPRARPTLFWLQGTALRRSGEMLEAESSFQAALDLDPRYRPALLDLADIASDRGERDRAISLLRRADVADDDPMLVLLESLDPQAGPQLGRNDPCWCGSGRKFKQCHLNRPTELSPDDRARWLYFKATSFVRNGALQSLIIDLAAIREPERDDPDEDGLLEALENDPLAADVALFEGGGLEEFLMQRGKLLPGADLDLATSWIAVSRSVYAIEGMGVGTNVILRDLRTGEAIEVGGLPEMAPIRAGRHLCARLLPVGAELRAFGGIEPVTDERAGSLIEVLDEIDDVLDECLEREIPDALLEVVADMDPERLAQAVSEAARELATSGSLPDDDSGDDDLDDHDLEDEDEDRRWAALTLMAALVPGRPLIRPHT